MVTTRRATPTDASSGPGDPSAAVTRFLDVRMTIPSTPHGAMLRPRVAATLDAGTAGRLTVVTGGPGWGKTSAVAAWSTAEPEDNDPARFWSTVVSAIVGAGVPPENPLTRLTAIERVTPARCHAVRRGIAALPGRTVLVLDDFHVVTAPDVLGGLATLLDHDLPLRLVLIGRVDPVPHRAVSIAGEHGVWLPFVGVPANRLRALLHRLLDVAPESRAVVSGLVERLPGQPGGPPGPRPSPRRSRSAS